MASLNQQLVSSAKSCKAIKEHEFGAVLRTAISDDNNNSFVDITLDPKTIKKYQKKAAGVVRPADVKSDSRLKAFENIRNQISCAAAMKFIFQSVHHRLFFSCDDVSILVNKMDDVKPKVILTKEAIEFLNSHHLSVSTDGAQEQQRMITFNLCIGGGFEAPSKVIKFADRNFEDLKIKPKIIILEPDLSIILYHPSIDEIQLNVWMFQICIIPQLELLRYALISDVVTEYKFFFSNAFFMYYRSKAMMDEFDGIPDIRLSQSSIPDERESTTAENVNEIVRRELIREKFKYVCIAFDGDHPQIAATERFLIPRSILKKQDLVFAKWAGGCSMTQSPNDNNRGMHPVLKKIYGDSKFRYDSIADPSGGKWALVKVYLKTHLEPASFRTVWKAMCYAPSTLQNACKSSSIRSAYHNTGIVDQQKLIDMQNGSDTDPSNPRTILGVNPFFNTFSKEDGEFVLGKIDEFAEITSRFGYIPEELYAKVLMGKTYLDNCPLLKLGAKPLNDMVTNRQRNIVMSNETFADQSRARTENIKMANADKESKEIHLKVFKPADKIVALQKKKDEKDRIEKEVLEVRRKKEEAKEEAKKEKMNEKNEVKRRREEGKGLNKRSKKNIAVPNS